MPPRTACGSAFVQRTARFDPGRRLHVLVLQPGRGGGLRSRQLRVRLPPSTRRVEEAFHASKKYSCAMSAHRTWTDEQLTEAVALSISMAEVLRRLGLRVGGGSQSYLFRRAQQLGLDFSHFKGQGWSRGNCKRPDEVYAALHPLLRRGDRKIPALRDRLIASGLKEERCEECGITEWRGKPVPLQVDHVDGDRMNNLIANLKILCANCHMQTETWGFKGARRRPPIPALVA